MVRKTSICRNLFFSFKFTGNYNVPDNLASVPGLEKLLVFSDVNKKTKLVFKKKNVFFIACFFLVSKKTLFFFVFFVFNCYF